MFFLKTLSKSVVEICNEREKFYSKVHIYVDFTTGRYYVMFYSSDVKQGMTDINKERDIFATYTYENDLDKVTGDPYDLYLSLKLKYDNTLRAKQYRELIQAQRKRILNAR